jgi:hypothetical protein
MAILTDRNGSAISGPPAFPWIWKSSTANSLKDQDAADTAAMFGMDEEEQVVNWDGDTVMAIVDVEEIEGADPEGIFGKILTVFVQESSVETPVVGQVVVLDGERCLTLNVGNAGGQLEVKFNRMDA